MSHDYNTVSQIITKLKNLDCFKDFEFRDERNFDRNTLVLIKRPNYTHALNININMDFEKTDFGIYWYITTTIRYGVIEQLISVRTPLYVLDGGFYGYEGRYEYHKNITPYMDFVNKKIHELTYPDYKEKK